MKQIYIFILTNEFFFVLFHELFFFLLRNFGTCQPIIIIFIVGYIYGMSHHTRCDAQLLRLWFFFFFVIAIVHSRYLRCHDLFGFRYKLITFPLYSLLYSFIPYVSPMLILIRQTNAVTFGFSSKSFRLDSKY